jgi:hypothetical protein
MNFSIKSVQTPFCEMPKTTQQSLFMLFNYHNCLQTQHQCRAATECSQSTEGFCKYLLLTEKTVRNGPSLYTYSFHGFFHIPHVANRIQLLFSNHRKTLRWMFLALSQDGVCTVFFLNFIVNSLRQDLLFDTNFSTQLFSHWSIPLIGSNSSPLLLNTV